MMIIVIFIFVFVFSFVGVRSKVYDSVMIFYFCYCVLVFEILWDDLGVLLSFLLISCEDLVLGVNV